MRVDAGQADKEMKPVALKVFIGKGSVQNGAAPRATILRACKYALERLDARIIPLVMAGRTRDWTIKGVISHYPVFVEEIRLLPPDKPRSN